MIKKKNPYSFLNTFYFRVPLFSIDFYKNLFEKKKISLEVLKTIWEKEQINEAILIASPVLYKELNKFFKEEIQQPKKREQLKQSFLKYLVRLSTRCTPFGMFASVGYGEISKETHMELVDSSAYEKINRLDTDVLSSILEFISKDPNVKEKLLFYTNTTLYKVANQYRYIEYQILNNKRLYTVEGVEESVFLEKILKKAKNGATIRCLVQVIIEIDTRISIEDANTFINTLIDNQFIVSELCVNLTGKDTLAHTIQSLKKIEAPSEVLKYVGALQHKLDLLNKKEVCFGKSNQEIQEMLKRLDISYNPKYLIQTDMFSDASTNKLKTKHLYTLKKLIPFLNKLSSYKDNTSLIQFKKAFLERYGSKEMPLAHVLDIESGIGYIQHNAISDTTPFLQKITPKNKPKDKNLSWTEVNEILLFKLLNLKGAFVLELTDKDFEKIALDWEHTPDTLSAFTEVFSNGEKEQVFLKGFSNNAGKLLGRFGYGNKKLGNHFKEITEIEKQLQPNKVLAEIVHLPEARTGNILKRPHVRDYEIPYLGMSTLPVDNQLLIDDLWIRIKNNRIILRSKKLNKEVVPKLTNAHNYAPKALPIYHFLCDLQSQNEKNYIGFSWPSVVENYSFLPRVIYKDVIISKATWFISKIDIEKMLNNSDKEEKLLEETLKFRNKLKIPRYVQYSKKDNSLLIDFQNIESIKLLLNSIKNKQKFRLNEFLFTNESVVKHKGKQFVNEFVFTFFKEKNLKAV
ncbi:lantibiotic dehydratase family protein [Tenacibaculum sp. 190524A02b]|uniref:lantibiotic dehydratase family protein n=1 Tax=Tenacibaculum vairaonense TaxID=3137860 RepID=UPI0031FAFD32